MKARDKGNRGEEETARILLKRGFEIVARNFTVRGGEIDIIARDGETLVFVEVKTRKENSLTDGESAVDLAKRRHIITAAKAYLKTLDSIPPCRFDVACVLSVSGQTVLRYYKNAFDASMPRTAAGSSRTNGI